MFDTLSKNSPKYPILKISKSPTSPTSEICNNFRESKINMLNVMIQTRLLLQFIIIMNIVVRDFNM